MRSYALTALAVCAAVLANPFAASTVQAQSAPNYRLVSTGQDQCFDLERAIPCPAKGQAFYGQDAQHLGHKASYRDNGDGTVLDQVTGLTWAKAPIRSLSHSEAFDAAKRSRLGGHDDWRVPSIKELYSLIDFRGGFTGTPAKSRPYIDSSVFEFTYGAEAELKDAKDGPRPIDVQEWSATAYIGQTMGRDKAIFGVNFADGRIKAYPLKDPMTRMTSDNRLNLRLVRGPAYGTNAFKDMGDGTVLDQATQLIWQQADDGQARAWPDALAYCAGLSLAGRTDWRLPNAKELQSIIDYSRRPAIDPVFKLSEPNAYGWTSTTHLEGPPPPPRTGQGPRPFASQGALAVYIAFGPAMGFMDMPPGSGQTRFMDVHGAGAQRSDPKRADPAKFPKGFGPQGDDIRVRNQVRCVAGPLA